jgi:hypothetical protein
MKNIVIGGRYKHYKGNQYYVLAVGKHSETQESLVVYMPLYVSDLTQVWIRPLKMFLENVVVEGKTKPRFQLQK